MTPAAAVAAYRRALGQFEDNVRITRSTGIGNSISKLSVDVTARVRSITDAELIGGIAQEVVRFIVLAADIEAAQFPAPAVGDDVYVRGRTRKIKFVDDQTKRLGGVLIAYVIRAQG